MGEGQLIGRERERAALAQAIETARQGHGGLVLLAGEAGIGKTVLAERVLAEEGIRVLVGTASPDGAPSYGPPVAALRSYLRSTPDGLDTVGRLAPYLRLLMPELGAPPDSADRATLVEALYAAFAAVGRREPAAVFLDDLHWADDATLDLLPGLARAVEAEPLLVVAAYRRDDIPRGHSLRGTLRELRRTGRLREIPLEPLDRAGTAALAARILGAQTGPLLAAALHDRTDGVPFFVEELAGALAEGGRLRRVGSTFELDADVDLPLAASVRDAVLLRLSDLPEATWTALEVAAVVGPRFDLGLVVDLGGSHEAIERAFEHGILVETTADQGMFRHALIREAVYGEIPWTRRRLLHRQVAIALETRGAAPGPLSGHWLAAREHARARAALLAAAESACTVHAYGDAASFARRALELWPDGEDEPGRLDVLDRLGHCAELSGDLAGAASAQREAVAGHRRTGNLHRAAEAGRRLATVHELQGSGERATAARHAAAADFAACGRPGDAAAERLAIASHTEAASAGLDLVLQAAAEIEKADRPDLRARALALEGYFRVKLGQAEPGLGAARAGLALALEKNLPEAAAAAYYNLASALEHMADHAGARDTFLAAAEFCRARGMPEMAHVCFACLAVMLRQIGEWERAVAVCRDVLASADSPPIGRAVAASVLGSIHARRGETRRARELLIPALAEARQADAVALEVDAAGSLALADALEGKHASAIDRCSALLERWRHTDERHYTIMHFRWAAGYLAGQGAEAEARACADALAQIAAATGYPDALAGLAHALAECALLDGDPARAALLFAQAIDRLRDVDSPYERAESQLRAGAALARAGEREAAIDRLTAAHRTARRLHARPLATAAAAELVALHEPVQRRLGRLARGHLERGGLTRREVEVLRLVAVGRTNREIAGELFLTLRTVDMHVHNLLGKLGSSSRAEAVHRANALGLLGAHVPRPR